MACVLANAFGNHRHLSNIFARRLCSAVVATDKSLYPPIYGTTPVDLKLRRKQKWHDKIKSHETVEEKLFELNMPRYYGWHAVMLHENSIPYDFLPYARFCTRTSLKINDEKMNEFYSNEGIDEQASAIAEKIQGQIEDALLFENICFKRKHEMQFINQKSETPVQLEDALARSVIKHLNRIILINLINETKHLRTVHVTPDPRVEACWFLGSVNPSQAKMAERKIRSKLQTKNPGYLAPELIKLPVNEPVQYIGRPILHLRSRQPLPEVEPIREFYKEYSDVPHVPYTPEAISLKKKQRHITTIPGFWPGEPQEFGLMSFHSRCHINERPPHFGADEGAEAVHASAILASYSWLLGQACYQGFSTFQDTTYPFVTQTVLTDGRLWSFYLYQLNTTLLHTKNSVENQRVNLCWGTDTMELYHKIEDGKIIGFNNDVLKTLVKMYLKEPMVREGNEYKPYLGSIPHIGDIDYEERRDWIQRHYKHLTTNRPRSIPRVEVHDWEYIYKIKFQTRPQDRNFKWYSREEPHPDWRPLDDRKPQYIPKFMRPEDKKKIRFAKNFYPGTNVKPED